MSAGSHVAWTCSREFIATLRQIALATDDGSAGPALLAAADELEKAGRSISDSTLEIEEIKRNQEMAGGMAELRQLRIDALEEMNAELAGLRALIPDDDRLTGKTLTECVATMAVSFPYAMEIHRLLRVARCPALNCEDGVIGSYASGELVTEPCEWCRDRDAALAKNPNPSGSVRAEASLCDTGEASGPVGLGPKP